MTVVCIKNLNYKYFLLSNQVNLYLKVFLDDSICSVNTPRLQGAVWDLSNC